MKVDKYELQKQRKEEILKKGEYIRLEIIVPKATTSDKAIEPITEFEAHNVNVVTNWFLVKMLDAVKESLIQKDPTIKLADMVLGTKIVDMGTTKKGDIAEVEE